LIVKTIKGIAEQSLQEIPQETVIEAMKADEKNRPIKDAPKIHTETCKINWSQPVEVVYNFVRGLSPYPAAFIIMNERMLKIFRANKEAELPDVTEGDYKTDGKSYLKFACTNGYLHLLEVQLEGKRRMKIGEFLKGYRFDQ
jgi:methionyl-tRNA formyltransferase